jgi:hypothetical protein
MPLPSIICLTHQLVQSYLVEGYAVRGFNRQTFEVNARPAELLPDWKPEYRLDPKRRLDESPENEASSTLLRVISSLSGEDDSHSDAFVQVNCSHALIRWLVRDDFPKAKELARSQDLCLQARGNLVLALAWREEPIPGIQMPKLEGRRYRIPDLKKFFHIGSGGATTSG